MSNMQTALLEPVKSITVVDRPDTLSAFLKPHCAAAIWRRQPPADFQSWLNALDPTCLPQGRIVLRREAVRSTVHRLCETSRTPAAAWRDELVSDITALAEVFAKMMQTSHLRLRLQVVTSNACRKFHVDAITARLVCTYRGTGTQYGFSNLGKDPTRVFTVPTGVPLLLRGSKWPEKPASGLLHRSPPIEGTGETRLVLVLDPVRERDIAE